MARYVLSNRSANGTSLQAYTRPMTYAQVVAVIGAPNVEGDGYKVSTEWCIEDTERMAGAVVTLYDYKATALYDEEGGMSVEMFRESVPYEWHIGAHNVVAAQNFKAWLETEVFGGVEVSR